METWERQTGESGKAYAAFAVYRELGNCRSYAKVGQQLNKSKTLIERWGRKFHWRERAQAYDDHVDELRIVESERARVLMLERQADYASELQRKAMEALHDLDPATLTAFQIVRFIAVGARIERECRGGRGKPLVPKIEVIVGETADELPYGSGQVSDLE